MPEEGANKCHAEEIGLHLLGSGVVTRSDLCFDLGTPAAEWHVGRRGVRKRQGQFHPTSHEMEIINNLHFGLSVLRKTARCEASPASQNEATAFRGVPGSSSCEAAKAASGEPPGLSEADSRCPQDPLGR